MEQHLPGVRGSFRWKLSYPTPEGGHVEEILTENEILESYYPHWVRAMRNLPEERQDFITPLECLRDWAVVHWAERV